MAIRTLIKRDGTLPVNIKVLIEGEEEIGSPNLPALIQKENGRLKADYLVISDTPMYASEQPSLSLSLRGLIYFEVTITTSNSDLHSGQHGGAAPNAIQSLIELLSKIKDEKNRIQVPGFYDDIEPLSPEISNALDALDFNNDDYCQVYDFKSLDGEHGYSTHAKKWYRPTCDINGIYGGYTGEGAKTVIPCQATAKISLRLVVGQDPNKIVENVKKFFNNNCPKTGTVKVEALHGRGAAISTKPSHPAVKAALKAIESVKGIKPVIQGEGGSIPILEYFKKYLDLDPILMGLNLPDDKIHDPNEQFSVKNYYDGIKIALEFYENCSDI